MIVQTVAEAATTKNPPPGFPKRNNLEWLRLVFASQVVLEHVAHYMGKPLPKVISYFPGVPAFFFVSGFLIYASYLNAPGRKYVANRFLRIFPGLAFVALGGAVVALIAHGWVDLTSNLKLYITWFVAQTTIGQAFNPAHFRDIGVGVINGSLWTLTTEILFYTLVPAIVWGERRFRHSVLTMFALSFAFYALGPYVLNHVVYKDKSIYDIAALTPLVWGWMFATGILAKKYFKTIRPWLKYAPLVSGAMLIMMFRGEGVLFAASGNRLGVVYFICYVVILLYFAFLVPVVRLPFDISYGVYVWHMPVVNLLLVLAIPSVYLSIVLTLFAAIVSWFLVEKPALKLKRRSLRPV